jgi:hypothetical protein
MSVDTKPNLSNCKFEQFSGDLLNLSGCTAIYGDFQIECGATLHILPGAGLGKYFTSDEFGNGTWQNFGGITGATNGLTKSGQNIVLGGTLISSTIIDLTTSYTFEIKGLDNPPFIEMSDTSSSFSTGHHIQLSSVCETNIFGQGTIKI